MYKLLVICSAKSVQFTTRRGAGGRSADCGVLWPLSRRLTDMFVIRYFLPVDRPQSSLTSPSSRHSTRSICYTDFSYESYYYLYLRNRKPPTIESRQQQGRLIHAAKIKQTGSIFPSVWTLAPSPSLQKRRGTVLATSLHIARINPLLVV